MSRVGDDAAYRAAELGYLRALADCNAARGVTGDAARPAEWSGCAAEAAVESARDAMFAAHDALGGAR